jgi:hypothetical protein
MISEQMVEILRARKKQLIKTLITPENYKKWRHLPTNRGKSLPELRAELRHIENELIDLDAKEIHV